MIANSNPQCREACIIFEIYFLNQLLNHPKAGKMKIIIEENKKISYRETKEEYKETQYKSMKKIL